MHLREMHMPFQYIKCWLDKGFNKSGKITKKKVIFLQFIPLEFEFEYYKEKNI